MTKLTTKTIEALKPGKARREIADHTPGLKLLLQPSGSRSWCFRYRLPGPMKLTLGRYPDISLDEARDLAIDGGKLVRRKVEPAVHVDRTNGSLSIGPRRIGKADQQPSGERTVEHLVDRFVDEYLAVHTRVSSQAITGPALRKATAAWQSREIGNITRADVKAAIVAAQVRGAGRSRAEKPGAAAGLKARTALSKFFGWCLDEELIDVSPAARLGKLPPVAKRNRTLDDGEIMRFWAATEQVEPWLKVFLRVLTLTAARRTEVAAMQWTEIKESDWLIPAKRAKNGRDHLLPLTPTVVDLLAQMPRAGVYVFTTGRRYRQGYGKAKQAIDAALAADGQPMEAWTFHDLRRTAATTMARIGVPEADIERVLNHARKKLVETYQVYDGREQKAAALARLEEHVLGLMGGGATNVVKLKRKALA